jgi:H+-translocating NAD(P) transhydrogenase subunit alpha
MIVGVLAESGGSERRVALVPAVIPMLHKAGHETCVERGAGDSAGYADDAYRDAGARIVDDRAALLDDAEAIVLLRAPAHVEALRNGQVAVGLFDPLGTPEIARQFAAHRVTAFALELLPRISRAQPMDALTSMATVAGYKSVLVAAAALDKMFPLMMTAAGTVTPAKVLVIGAGVAGLQAIATAHRLGAVVEAYDVRPAVKEQVESLGGKFLELALAAADSETSGGYARAMDEEFYRRQRALLGEAVAASDVVIATAAVPGRTAPLLITADAVHGMRRGAVVVDLAAESGGNCELTRAGETVVSDGVSVIGPINLASTVAHHASQMYARNVAAFLRHVSNGDGSLRLDLDDEITRGCLLAHAGEVVHPLLRERLGIAPERIFD